MAKLDRDIVWESKDLKLFGITLDNNLKLDKHVSNIYSKANRKLSELNFVEITLRHGCFLQICCIFSEQLFLKGTLMQI